MNNMQEERTTCTVQMPTSTYNKIIRATRANNISIDEFVSVVLTVHFQTPERQEELKTVPAAFPLPSGVG